MGKNKLARDLKISVQEAEDKIKHYMDTYPAVQKFMEEAREESKKTGYAYSVLGRRRNIPMIGSSRKDQQALGERLAVNHQIQSSAADVCRAAQTMIHNYDLDTRYDTYIILQVHDELLFESPEEAARLVVPEIEEIMSHPFSIELPCPLLVEAGIGPTWGDAH